jgi:P27 family predicted phage terminase small subunit
MTNPTRIKLSVEARRLYRKIVQEWGIEDRAGLFLLTTALEAHDEMREAQEVLKCEGVVLVEETAAGKRHHRLHPMVQREKEARAHMLQAFKQLNLDLDSIEKDK